MYKNIEVILATKHKKEEAIRAPFEEAFESKIFVPQDYDTDQFGTFTGERLRVASAYETVINKAKQACIQYNYNYGIANEGSFGRHPTIFFAPGDIELIVFIDIRNEIIVTESEITTETNYAHIDLKKSDHYNDFLKKAQFGSHAIVLRELDNNKILAKGINKICELQDLLDVYFKEYKQIRLETDMRAFVNPTRMKVIARLALKLISRLKQLCKQCGAPGFGVASVFGHLSCIECGAETELYEKKVLKCIRCDYAEYLPREDGLTISDSQYCPSCNP